MNHIVRFFLMSGITIVFGFISSITYSQNIGINGSGVAPHISAMLDVLSSNKGILIPRVALTGTGDVATINTSTTSLMVYNTATAGSAPTNVLPGFYYWDDVQWVAFGGTGGRDWSLLGNAGTVNGTHFLGTTDNETLNFRVNNKKAGRIEPFYATFLGYQAGNSNNNGDVITGIGYRALYSNTTGVRNTAAGSQALFSNTIGYENIAIGSQASYSNTIGYNNTAVGYQALYSNTNGYFNTAIGYQALYSNKPSAAPFSGANNVATGSQALYSNTAGGDNVASGFQALYFNTIGSNNTIDGYQAAYGETGFSHSNNAVFGYKAGFGLRTGSNNIFLGYQAGDAVTTGSNNIVIGYDIDAPSNTGNNQMTIGNLIFGTGLSATGTTISTGSVGIGTNAPAYILDVAGDINSSTNVRTAGVILTSDARLKKNIMNLNAGSETIMKLRPVSYQKKESLEATEYTKNEIGFIAQEVQKVLPQLVYEGKDKDKILALDYNSLIPIITKALQEHQTELGQLKKENDTLQKQIEEVLNDLNIHK